MPAVVLSSGPPTPTRSSKSCNVTHNQTPFLPRAGSATLISISGGNTQNFVPNGTEMFFQILRGITETALSDDAGGDPTNLTYLWTAQGRCSRYTLLRNEYPPHVRWWPSRTPRLGYWPRGSKRFSGLSTKKARLKLGCGLSVLFRSTETSSQSSSSAANSSIGIPDFSASLRALRSEVTLPFRSQSCTAPFETPHNSAVFVGPPTASTARATAL